MHILIGMADMLQMELITKKVCLENSLAKKQIVSGKIRRRK
jgi:hypothetical protein